MDVKMQTLTTGRIHFPGAVVWFSYSKPTKIDEVGCDGVYVRRILITNAVLFMLYALLVKIGVCR